MLAKALLLAIAAILILVGVPNLIAATWMAIGQPVYDDLESGKPVSQEDFNLLIESREAAIALTDDAEAYADLAVAHYVRGELPGKFEKAIEASRLSLERKPIDAFTWQNLALISLYVPDGREEALTAWRASYALGKYSPDLYHVRFLIGTVLYRDLTPEDRELLMGDVNGAYARDRGAFRHYARDNNLLEWAKFLLRDPEKTKFLTPG